MEISPTELDKNPETASPETAGPWDPGDEQG